MAREQLTYKERGQASVKHLLWLRSAAEKDLLFEDKA